MASSLGGVRICLTLSTWSPHKPVKSSYKRKPEKQKNEQTPFRWLSYISVAQLMVRSFLKRAGDLGSTPHWNSQDLLSSTAGSTICLWGIFTLPEARRIIQPRCLSGTAQADLQMQTWLQLWPECHNGSRGEPAPSWRHTGVGRANAVSCMCDFLHSIRN